MLGCDVIDLCEAAFVDSWNELLRHVVVNGDFRFFRRLLPQAIRAWQRYTKMRDVTAFHA